MLGRRHAPLGLAVEGSRDPRDDDACPLLAVLCPPGLVLNVGFKSSRVANDEVYLPCFVNSLGHVNVL